MSDRKCPECGNELGKRAPNTAENVRRRELESIWERYVCRSCEQTFSRREIDDAVLTEGWFWE